MGSTLSAARTFSSIGVVRGRKVVDGQAATAGLGKSMRIVAPLDVLVGKSPNAVKFFSATIGRANQPNGTMVLGKRLALVNGEYDGSLDFTKQFILLFDTLRTQI